MVQHRKTVKEVRGAWKLQNRRPIIARAMSFRDSSAIGARTLRLAGRIGSADSTYVKDGRQKGVTIGLDCSHAPLWYGGTASTKAKTSVACSHSAKTTTALVTHQKVEL